MAKRFIGFILAVLLCMTFVGCPNENETQKEEPAVTDNNSGGGNNTPTTVPANPNTNKITSLQLVINDTSENGTIDLSQYADITDYSATIDKSLTINGANKSLLGDTLTVASTGVTLSGITNVSVTASSSLGNGSLKIASSSLSSLSIYGGGIGSIVLEDASIDNVIVDKDMTAQDAQYVRLEVDNQVKVGNLKAASPLFLDGVVSDNTWLGSLDLSTDDINIAVSKDVSVDLGNGFVNVACYNDDASTDRLQMNIAMKKGSEFNTDLFAAAFTKEYGDDAVYDNERFISDVAAMATKIDLEHESNYNIYLVMTHVDVTLRIEDLPNSVGAVFIYGWLPDAEWVCDPNNDKAAKYIQKVKNGVCEFKLGETQIDKHWTPNHYTNGKWDYGGTAEGFQFFIVPMENEDSYKNVPTPWVNSYFTPAVDGTETGNSYTGITKDGGEPPTWVHYVILKEWVSIGGKMNYMDNGEFDGYYDRAINIKFDELVQKDKTIITGNKKYVKITINPTTYPEMYYSDPDFTVESIPTFPTNVGYKDESVDLTIGHRPRKITLYGSDFDNPSRGYDISFSAEPFND
ncbi:MAG: hypothetical protein IKQ61_05395 [Spirochaetales bacterium]|nr:hypothetical protein [Spirochaetales bacterium]